MSWRGGRWAEEAVEGHAERELVNINNNIPVLPVPSFTPINLNHAPAPFPFISPLTTRYDRALDTDAFYDLAPNCTLSTKPKEERHISAVGWNDCPNSSIYPKPYPDEGSHAQDILAEEPPKKRPKSSSLTRSKSSKPGEAAFNRKPDQDETLAATQGAFRGPLDNSHSQLASPLDSRSRRPKGAENVRIARQGRKMGPFKNLVITKPKNEPKTTPTPALQHKGDAMRPMTNHLGWTTTQDAVKLSKTTLDRLATFRYTSVSTEKQYAMPRTNSKARGMSDHAQNTQHERVIFRSSDGTPSYNTTFPNKLNLDRTQPRESWTSNEGCHLPAVQLQLPDPQNSAHGEKTCHMEDVASLPGAVSNSTDRHVRTSCFTDLGQQFQVHGTNNFSSSPTHLSISQQDLGVAPYAGYNADSSARATSTPPLLLGISNSEIADESFIDNELTSDGSKVTRDMPGVIYGVDQPVVIILPTCPGSNSAVALLGGDLDQAGFDVHEDKSTPCFQLHAESKADLNPQMSFQDNPDSDSFDDDIDDEDLVDLECTSDVLGNASAASRSLSTFGNDEQLRANEPLNEPPAISPTHQTNIQLPLPEDQEKTLTSHVAKFEVDDEYPLDDGDEEEMLNLHEMGVAASIEVPRTLNDGAQEDCTSREVLDISLQCLLSNTPALLSPGKMTDRPSTDHNSDEPPQLPGKPSQSVIVVEDEEDWSFIRSDGGGRCPEPGSVRGSQTRTPATSPIKSHRTSATEEIDRNLARVTSSRSALIDLTQSTKHAYILDDSHEYTPLHPFARPDFPSLMRDRSPIVGLSAQTFLRVCFRVGEMFKEGGRCESLNQNAVIELYARVTFSSREAGTTKQHFQFADLWHDRPPYPNGMLANYKSSGLAETESRVFVGATESIMARCLGTLKRHNNSANGWLLHILSIRETDWEEIRWTKRIVSAGLVKTEKPNL